MKATLDYRAKLFYHDKIFGHNSSKPELISKA